MSVKIQCPSCREVVPLQEFRTSAEGLWFRCPECKQVQSVMNARSLAEEPARRSPAAENAGAGVICPKCGHAQTGGENCALCGLNFEHGGQLLAPPPALVQAFERLDSLPDDPSLLEEFVIACDRAGRLDWATRQARILSRVPERAALAAALRARVAERAQAQIVPFARADRSLGDTDRRKRIWLWATLVLSLGLLLWIVYSAGAMLQKMP